MSLSRTVFLSVFVFATLLLLSGCQRSTSDAPVVSEAPVITASDRAAVKAVIEQLQVAKYTFLALGAAPAGLPYGEDVVAANERALQTVSSQLIDACPKGYQRLFRQEVVATRDFVEASRKKSAVDPNDAQVNELFQERWQQWTTAVHEAAIAARKYGAYPGAAVQPLLNSPDSIRAVVSSINKHVAQYKDRWAGHKDNEAMGFGFEVLNRDLVLAKEIDDCPDDFREVHWKLAAATRQLIPFYEYGATSKFDEKVAAWKTSAEQYNSVVRKYGVEPLDLESYKEASWPSK